MWPPYSKTIDYELEFACVIGKGGKDIPRDKAREHIFGYTIFNDLSARDEQSLEMLSNLGPGKGKDFDNSNPIGPCIVTADEIPDPYALEMIVRVDGEERGRGNTREMHWKYEDCIAFVARVGDHPSRRDCSARERSATARGLETGRYRRSRARPSNWKSRKSACCATASCAPDINRTLGGTNAAKNPPLRNRPQRGRQGRS